MKKIHKIHLLFISIILLLSGCSRKEAGNEDVKSSDGLITDRDISNGDYINDFQVVDGINLYLGDAIAVPYISLFNRQINISVQNKSGCKIGYDGSYFVEKKEEDSWRKVITSNFDSYYRLLDNNKKMSLILPNSEKLEDGEYKIYIKLLELNKDTEFYVYGSFVLQNNVVLEGENTDLTPISFQDSVRYNEDDIIIKNFVVTEDKIKFTLVNESEGEIGYGKSSRMEKTDGKVWDIIRPKKEIMSHDMLYLLMPGEEVEIILINPYNQEDISSNQCKFLVPIIKNDISYFLSYDFCTKDDK